MGRQLHSFTKVGNKLYFIQRYYSTVNKLNSIQYIEQGSTDINSEHTTGYKFSSGTIWHAETGNWGMYVPDNKYICGLDIKLVSGGAVFVQIRYDTSDYWEDLKTIQKTKLKTIRIPINGKRHEYFRLKISGNRNCKIYSIIRKYEQGSDINV